MSHITLEPSPALAGHTRGRSAIRRMARRSILSMLAVLAAAASLGPAIAAAATNGQQIEVVGFAQWSVTVCGTNQNNVPNVCNHWNTPTQETPLFGWWWKGTVKIYNYGYYGQYLGSKQCYVPVYQWSNWTFCPGAD
jgi:hypothetical protein